MELLLVEVEIYVLHLIRKVHKLMMSSIGKNHQYLIDNLRVLNFKKDNSCSVTTASWPMVNLYAVLIGRGSINLTSDKYITYSI